jgi:hypothetical protein
MLLELFEHARRRWTLRRRIAEELQFHLAEAADAYAADGMTARSAREYAKLRLGDRRAITRDCLALATEQGDPALKPWRIPVRAYAAAMLVPPILALVLVPHHFAPLPQAASGLAVSSKRVPGAFELAEDPTQGVAAFRHTSATYASARRPAGGLRGPICLRQLFRAATDQAATWGRLRQLRKRDRAEPPALARSLRR